MRGGGRKDQQTGGIPGAAVSRKLKSPLAIMIQSSSAAGKTWLMESVLAFMPEEERIKYSAMTGQSLFYMGETNIRHKILALVEEEGAERTRYALKLLQSEGELSIASTGKDPVTGLLGTKEYRVQGPVMIFSATTSIEIDEELQNRCIILTVDESREQTRAIHQQQRKQRTLRGLQLSQEKSSILKLHRNAQRLLRPLPVVNTYANQLTFLDDKTRTRRDHEKYLSLIDSITFLHQYQRQIKINPDGYNGKPEETIMVTIEDIELANRLANEVLGRSLDELTPQTRNMLMIIDEMVEKECKKLQIERSEYRFSRRQVREYCKWGNTQLKMHFKRLEELEYLIVHRGNRGLTFEYELLYDGNGKDGSMFLMGLINVDKLRTDQNKGKYDEANENKSGVKGPNL
jgi:DNA primase